jgi:fumarate reductase subunit D
MFRSSIIIRELALNLVKVIFRLKHSVKLRRYLLCGCMSACHGMACVLCAVQNVGAIFMCILM